MGVLLRKRRLQVLMLRDCGRVLYTKCPKHLNLKAEDLRMYEGRCGDVDKEKL